MLDITLYTKDGCWLCEQVESYLNSVKEGYGLNIKRIEITRDPETYELYRFDIPVVEFPGGKVLYGRIKKADLRRLIDEHKE